MRKIKKIDRFYEKKKMKILIVTTVAVGYDGLTSHIFSYVKNMNKADLIIDLVSARGLDDQIKQELNDIGFDNIYRLEYRDTNQIQYLIELIRLIKKNRYDILHAHGNSATLAVEMLAGFIGKCRIRIAHSHTTSCTHKWFHKLLKPLFNLCYTNGFACGIAAGEWLFGKKDFMVIPNGREISKYKFNSAIRGKYREKLNLNNDDIALVNIAAFEKHKNHKFLIDVYDGLLKKNENYELFLFGIAGSTLNCITEEIERRKLQKKIHIMGTRSNIQDYLQAMDILLFPSHYEGLAMTVLECQISGMPCILSNSITREVSILNTNVFLPINEGSDCWIEEIEKIDVKSAERNHVNAEKIFSDAGFNVEKNAANLKQIYFDILKARST